MKRILFVAAVVICLCSMLAFSGCNSGKDTEATKIKQVKTETSVVTTKVYATIPNTGNEEYSPRY